MGREPELAHQLAGTAVNDGGAHGVVAHGVLWCSFTAVALARTLMLMNSTATENAIAKYV
jgi:hypothetical protein